MHFEVIFSLTDHTELNGDGPPHREHETRPRIVVGQLRWRVGGHFDIWLTSFPLLDQCELWSKALWPVEHLREVWRIPRQQFASLTSAFCERVSWLVQCTLLFVTLSCAEQVLGMARHVSNSSVNTFNSVFWISKNAFDTDYCRFLHFILKLNINSIKFMLFDVFLEFSCYSWTRLTPAGVLISCYSFIEYLWANFSISFPLIWPSIVSFLSLQNGKHYKYDLYKDKAVFII